MTYQTITQANATGLGGILAYVQDIVPVFIPLTLLSFYVVVALASYYIELSRRGVADFSTSVAVAGFATFALSLAMATRDGLINTYVSVIVFVVMVLGVFWMLGSARSN